MRARSACRAIDRHPWRGVALAGVFLALGPQAPEVKIVTPRIDEPLSNPIVIQALVRVPPGTSIRTVSAFLDERDLGVRTRPPYRWVVPLPADASAVHVRIVATDSRGRQSSTEELVTRTPGMRFTAEVPAVSLNLSALDDADRFISDLRREEITVRDNGEVQEILDFARGDAPLRVAILLDRSRSMEDRMPETLAALVDFLGELGPEDQVKLMGFNDRITSYTPFTNMHELVGAFAQGITAQGSTALFDAVVYGYRQLASHEDARERRVIFVLTDGDDQASRTALKPALELVRNGGVTIFALGQGDALDEGDLRDVLRQMADETGGEAIFEEDARKLETAFGQIAQAMRALYLVSYRPTSNASGWHDLEVEVSRPGLRLRFKPGYERDGTEGIR